MMGRFRWQVATAACSLALAAGAVGAIALADEAQERPAPNPFTTVVSEAPGEPTVYADENGTEYQLVPSTENVKGFTPFDAENPIPPRATPTSGRRWRPWTPTTAASRAVGRTST